MCDQASEEEAEVTDGEEARAGETDKKLKRIKFINYCFPVAYKHVKNPRVNAIRSVAT
jgi:hypothetical protein